MSNAPSRLSALAFLLTLALAGSARAADVPAALTVEGEAFVMTLPDGKRLAGAELVGAAFKTQEGQAFRIESVAPSKERPALLLYSLSMQDAATGAWSSACQPDAQGRQSGFPVAGRWGADGQYVKDPAAWFLTCTSGSQGKCVLWGYDPWAKGPKGEDLTPFYQACQHVARATYDGRGLTPARDGAAIDLADTLGLQRHDSLADPTFAFEAGWGPKGAVCVARTRFPDLLPLDDLLKAAPALGGKCDEAEARKRGALIFTRVKKR